jgi:hypothetical protein
MYRRLAIAAVTAAAILGAFAVSLAGTAAADAYYYVQGAQTVNVRALPNVRADVIDHRYSNSAFDLLDIVCQTRGDSVTDPVSGFTSNIWDKIIIGGGGIPPTVFYGYVSDLYASTPVAGDFSPGIPKCSDLPLRGPR